MTSDLRRILWQGLGRAAIEARRDPQRFTLQHRDAILDACLHCRVYDFQLEGDRAGYMRDIIAVLPDRQFYEDAVIEAVLRGPATSGAHTEHRFRFAALLAAEGNTNALEALYQGYRPGLGVEGSLMEAGGIAGFQFVARRCLEEDAWFVFAEACDLFGEAAVIAAEPDFAVKAQAPRPTAPQRLRQPRPETTIVPKADHQQALQQFLDEGDPDASHRMEEDLLDLWLQHPDPVTEPAMLRAVYEKSACGLCRGRSIERMLELGILPEDVRAECAFDADERIREITRTPG